ncbi:unnamed protein product [Blepharisma stoltei]|uniref:Uncharacterized protein n=1 Tax=Blepharisma stoltei TaxID=1481888 RepID=A0AAU9IX29_9CILI|nr:unnamed protein product [Blepharisma stoltei]
MASKISKGLISILANLSKLIVAIRDIKNIELKDAWNLAENIPRYKIAYSSIKPSCNFRSKRYNPKYWVLSGPVQELHEIWQFPHVKGYANIVYLEDPQRQDPGAVVRIAKECE